MSSIEPKKQYHSNVIRMQQDTNNPRHERVKHKLSEQWEGQAALQAESIPQ